MSLTLPRRRTLCTLLAAVPLAALPALTAPGAAEAATVYACKAKRGGAIRLVAKKTTCRRSEKKLSWGTTGPRGRSGAPGAAGARCQNAVLLNVAEIEAGGADASAYGSAVLRRPTGIDALPNEPTTSLRNATTLQAGRVTDLAAVTTLAESEGSTAQLGVWHVTVESPTSTTFLTATFEAGATCRVRGSALTVPFGAAL